MADYIVTEYTKTFEAVNLGFKKSDERGYDYTTLLIYTNQCSKGFMVKKINKTTKKGTTVIYKAIKGTDEMKLYKELIIDMVNDFNVKWSENVQMAF